MIIRIAVGSTNPCKIEAVREAFSGVFRKQNENVEIVILPFSAESGVCFLFLRFVFYYQCIVTSTSLVFLPWIMQRCIRSTIWRRRNTTGSIQSSQCRLDSISTTTTTTTTGDISKRVQSNHRLCNRTRGRSRKNHSSTNTWQSIVLHGLDGNRREKRFRIIPHKQHSQYP